jgi:hypothetical protein
MSRILDNTLRAGLVVTALVLTCLPAFSQDTQDKKPASGSTDKTSGEQRVERNFPSTAEPTFTPVELQPVSAHITLNQNGDTKDIYDHIGKSAGLTVLFDPDYVSRSIQVNLRSVPVEEALQAVAFESKTFWRPVTPTSIFITQDTFAKRREIEQSVIKVFYLPPGSSQTEMQDVSNMLRTILDITRVQPMWPAAVVMRGTAGQVELASKLVDQVNKSRPKFANYRVEVSVAEMDGRTKLKSRSYRMFLQPDHGQKLNIVPVVPVASESEPETAKESTEKGKGPAVPYQNIDCNIVSESERGVSLVFRGTFSDFSDSGISGQPEKDVRQFSVDARPTIPFDKSTVIDSFDDPSTHHTVQVELIVTRLPQS